MARHLEYYGGNGFGVSNDTGFFVVHSDIGPKTFTNFLQAKQYYDSIEGEKAFWDTTRIPELIDAWHFIDGDDQSIEEADLPL